MANVWHPELGQEFRERVNDTIFSQPDNISVLALQNTLKQLAVWPLFEALDISHESLERLISGEEKDRLNKLKDTTVSYLVPDLHNAFSIEHIDHYSFRVVTPDDRDYLASALDQVNTCYQRKKLNGIIGRFMQDVKLGGSILYFLEKEGVPVVYNKLFLVKSQKGNTALFYDSVENGNLAANKLKQWEEVEKLPELAFSMAFAAYMAQELDIIRLALADRELDEAGAVMGCRRSYILPHQQRKVGMVAHPENKGLVVYQNRLFKTANNKHRTLQVTKSRRGSELIEHFNRVYDLLAARDFDPTSKRFDERLQYMTLAHQAVQLMESGSSSVRSSVEDRMRAINSRVEDYSLDGL